MPDGGYDGWYSDWYGIDVDGHNGLTPYAWETFHTRELIDFVEAEYPRVRHGQRYIAGLSMGGYGAMIYAERHPELGFRAVGSFSGALDTQLLDPAEPEVQPVFQNAPDRKLPDNCIWGDGQLQHDVWTEHNPAALENVGRLADIPVYASAGDGCAPSAANPDPTAPGTCAQAGMLDPARVGSLFSEWGVRQQNQSFRSAVESYCDGHPCAERVWNFYSAGDHTWSYWLTGLREFLNWVLPVDHS
jgi:diacylglycerol O-acyltransferase / trehalose O-mycolyltransferase